MISSLSRNLPRATAAWGAASTPIIRPSPYSSIVASSTHHRPMPARRLPFHYPRASFVGASPVVGDGDGDGEGEDDDDDKNATAGLKGDAIADIVAAEHELKLSDSRKIVATVFDTIVEAIAKKETVVIPRFGKFASIEVAAREYTNPQDLKGPRIMKPPTTRIKFTPKKHFKDCVAGVVVERKKK